MATTFAVTWDYRCPFARNAHEHIVAGLLDGADWDVQFLAFSLGQAHEPAERRWSAPDNDTGLLALQAAVVVRDQWPEHFLATHIALFEARHERGAHIREREVISALLAQQGLDADAVLDEVDTGRPLATVRFEHDGWAASHHVWGVPTFVVDDAAVFVRLMDRPEGDAKLARRTVERVLDLMAWPELNEFKHTSLPK
jgi:hypothetical protein